jgi:hypothetical protein
VSADAEEDAAESMRLLSDLRGVWRRRHPLHGATVLPGLHKIAEAPWQEYFGKSLSARGHAGRSLARDRNKVDASSYAQGTGFPSSASRSAGRSRSVSAVARQARSTGAML